jgi:hypothetical protein
VNKNRNFVEQMRGGNSRVLESFSKIPGASIPAKKIKLIKEIPRKQVPNPIKI